MPQAQPQIKTGAWDQDEDDLLYYWQGKVGNKWSEVAKHIPGRTGQQCAQRWRHKVNPNIRRDKWTSEEDAKLIELVKTFGVGRWAEIARNCDGRTDQQCMGRWRRHLDPSIRRDSWSPEEDAKLRQLHAQYGTSWSRISKCLKGRTSQQCRARWHQINNGRGISAPASNGTGSDTATGGRHQGAAGGRRGGPGSRRRASRRRADSSASEDDEEDEADEELDDDDLADDEHDYEHHIAASALAGHQHLDHATDQNSYHDPHDRAYAAAIGVGGYGLDHLPKPDPQQHQEQEQRWDSSFVAAAAAATGTGGHHLRSDLAYPSDQEEANDDAFEGDCAGEAYNEGDVSDGYQAAAAAANPGDDKMMAAVRSGSPQRCHNLVGSSQQHQAAGAAVAASHSKVQRACVNSPSPLKAWQPQLAGDAFWSPSRLLLSPPQGSGKPWPGQGSSRIAYKEESEELNDEETAGAETLLQMAHLLRRESCEFQPPSLRRSDFITASTPPKRPADKSDLQLVGDPLSPSPCKRARSSRSAAFFRHSPGCVEDGPAGLPAESLQHQVPPRAHSSAAAAADVWASRRQGKSWAAEGEEDPEEGLTEQQDGQEMGSLQARLDAAAAAVDDDDGVDDDAGYVKTAGAEPGGSPGAQGAAEEAGGASALGARLPPGMAQGMLGFGISTAQVSHNSRGLFEDGPHSLPGPPARPSNASCLTGLRYGAEAAAAAAMDNTAAVFMSPPPAMRTAGRSSRQMVTPRRPPPQQNLVNMLCSPSFDRVTGGVTPPSAGHTQPSAATLAALQSPLPSRVHEPFWTPFTGLFKDALFSRGTSATPDLPSGGKARTGSLFSPAGKRSSSGSKGSAGLRQPELVGASPDTNEDALHTEDGAHACGLHDHAAAAAVDSEPGPSPACRLQQSVAAVHHHRVVRRLDQHEAWGACPAGTKGAAGGVCSKAGGGNGECDGPRSIGFSLFSPVKKQRVPLFDESSTINVGVSPAKPPEPEEDPLAIAPLMHHLPANGIASSFQTEQLPGSQHAVRAAAAAVGAAYSGLQGPQASSGTSRVPTASWKRPPASRLLSSPTFQWQSRQRQQHGDQQQQEKLEQPEHEQEQQHLHGELWPISCAPLVSSAEFAAQQEQGSGTLRELQEVKQRSGQQQQQQQQQQQPTKQEQLADPNTPVHDEPISGDNTSCSGTPNTPAAQRKGLVGLLRGAASAASPDEYITPQHRVRPVKPLAPLHKDCLIAAATRCLASTMAAAAAAAAAANGQQSCGQATPESKEEHDAGAAGATGSGEAVEQPMASAAGVGAAVEAVAAVSADAVPVYQEQPSSSAVCSGDSSKLSPMAQVMDSPLQPCQQLQSPSQWHQGMVAMLRNLQQTPLQPKALAGDCRGVCQADQAGDSVIGSDGTCAVVNKGCEGTIKTGSRALRRLQDELERGSSMAAQQQPHAASGRAGRAAGYGGSANAGEMQMPFSSSSTVALAPAAAVLVMNGPASAPRALPALHPAANMSKTGQAAPAAGGKDSRSTPLLATPTTAAQPSGGVASVSWTPAVISRAEGSQLVTMVQTPPTSGMSAVTPATVSGPALGTTGLQLNSSIAPALGAPAVAWPVQQRPDGGLVVAASAPSSVVGVPGLTQAVAAPSQVQLGAPLPAAAVVSSGSGACRVGLPPASVVLAGVKGVASLPTLFALSAESSALEKTASAVPGALGDVHGSNGHVAMAGGVSLDLRCDSSHVVRSRLHALIDGV